MLIRLARHGETDDNREPLRVQGRRDVPLNARGVAQAHELANALATDPPDTLYASPLLRARQTAEILAETLTLEPTFDARLAESDRGEWEGRLFNEIEREDPDNFARWRQAPAEFRFPGGESLAEQQQRVVEALEEIRGADHTAPLVVCHGGSIRVALCHYNGRRLEDFHGWEVLNGAVVELTM